MSGPVYPPSPAPGSNAIGTFVIGVSPIGTISRFDVWATIISQYANSAAITALCQSFASEIDPTRNMEDFFDLIWNVDTAAGYGLDVWGRIVGVNRILTLITPDTVFGFEEPEDPTEVGFNQAQFYAGTGGSTQNFVLTDQAYRQLILAKALFNICDGSIPAINTVLMELFSGFGNAYVADDGGMSITYTTKFKPSDLQRAIIEQSGVLPTPCGVHVNYSYPP